MVRRYIDERQNNGGVIHLLYQFVTLLSLRYDHKWWVCMGGAYSSHDLGMIFLVGVDMTEHL